jgi:hypothetical protein
MIHPSYLATIRKQLRAELVITMVQLEQVAPMWWPCQSELAEQLGTERRTLTTNLRKLESMDLIRRIVIGNTGGTWIWWVNTIPHTGREWWPELFPFWGTSHWYRP